MKVRGPREEGDKAELRKDLSVPELRAWGSLPGAMRPVRAAAGRSEAGLNAFEQLSISAGWLDCGPSSPTLQVLFPYPGYTLPLGKGSVVAASFPPLLGGSPQPGLN